MIEDLLPRLEDDFHRRGLQYSQAVLAAYSDDASAAESLLADVESRSQTERMVAETTWHLRASSLVKLLGGDPEAAYEIGMQAVVLEPTGMNTPSSVVQCARAAAWMRDAAKLRQSIAAMRGLPGAWIGHCLRAASAAGNALAGRIDDAATEYAAVLDEWSRQELPLDHAWCVIDALAVLPAELVSQADVDRARATWTELGATALLRRIEAPIPVEAS